MITPERLIEQRARLRHLKEKLNGSFPARKKPAWENLQGLRQACLDRCVQGVTNKDGKDAYDPLDIGKIPKMNIKACEAWLNERTEGTFSAFVFISYLAHQVRIFIVFAIHC